MKEFNVDDHRTLIVRMAEYKNSHNVTKPFDPPKTLGMPTDKRTKEYKDVMAMDRCIKNVLSGFNTDAAFMAAPAFVGYAMLSNVSQEALIRAGVETVADEMTRKFIQWTYDDDDGETDKEKELADLEEQAAKYKLKEVFNDAALKDGYFGGCLVYIDLGDLDDLEKEEPLVLDEKTFKKGSLKGFRVIEPINVYPGEYNTSDPTDEHYFNPEFWYVLGKKYHASRFLYFAGNPTPVLLKPAYNFFGIPQAQLALDYVAHFVANREAAQELLNKFSLTCWKTDMTQAIQGNSCHDLISRVKMFNRLKNNNGTMVLDKETEDMMQINTPLSGVRDIVDMSLSLLTAVWRIPKIKYLGEGEGGLNASSKEQMRSFYDYILSQKEKLFTQPLETVLKLFQLNMGKKINPAIGFKYPAMWDMDDSEKAALNKQQADRDAVYLANGVLSQEEVRRRLSLDRNSEYTMIDVDDVPEPQAEPLKDVNEEEENETVKKAMDMALDGVKRNWRGRMVMDYDPNQKRDNFGKWSNGVSEAFERAIDSVFLGKYEGNPEILVLTRPTKIWTDVGLPKGKITFNKNKIEKIIEKHSLKRKDFEGLPNLLANPEMIFESATDTDAFVAVLKRTTSPLIAAVLPIRKEGKAKNIVKSMYKKGKSFIEQNTKEGRLLYDKENPKQIRQHSGLEAQESIVSDAKSETKDASIAAEFSASDSDIIAQDFKDVNVENEDYCIELFFLDDLDGERTDLTEDMAMDDRWITIGHRDGNGEEDEGRKGRHILLKEGETPTEAIERTTGTDIDKDGKVGKKDGGEEKKSEPKTEEKKEEKKAEPKPEPKPESKEEPKKEEKKETEQEKTPAIEYAELLDKEKASGLSDAEKARKKELEDKEGFGEKEKKPEDMTDEELASKDKELSDKYSDMMNRRKEELRKAKEEDGELKELQKEYDELYSKLLKIDHYTDEGHELDRKMNELTRKINSRHDEIFDIVNKKYDKEYNELGEVSRAIQSEKNKRREAKNAISEKKKSELMNKLTGIMTKADEISDEDFIKSIQNLEEEVKNAGLNDLDRVSALEQIQSRGGKLMFTKKADTVGKKVKEYSKTTDALIKEFETFDDPYEKWSKEREEARTKLEEMRNQRDKEQDPEKKKKLESAITMQILQSHFSVASDDLNKIKYERTMAVANILRKQKNTGTQVVAGKSTIKGIYDKLNGVLGGVIGKNIRTDDAPKVQAMRGRAYYSSSDNMFKVEKDADFGDVIHEYTHFLERNNSRMLANSLAFAEYRTKGEDYQRLSALTGNRAYKGGEIAKKDRFFSPYCGKIYSQDQEYRTARASEIMSMGVERLFREPAKFAKEDREYFDFVVANLRGEL